MAKPSRQGKRWWLTIPIAAIIIGGGYYYSTYRAQPEVSAEASMQTTKARIGDLVISATAAGTAIASSEVSLGFPTDGELLELYVAEGDVVHEGDKLARIDDLSARMAVAAAEKSLTSAETALSQAQDDLADLSDPSNADLLEAQAAVTSAQEALNELQSGASAAELATAQAAVVSAQEAYDELIAQPDADTVDNARLNLEKAKNSLWSAQSQRDAQGVSANAYDPAQISVLNAEISVEQAEKEYAAAQEPATDAEIKNAYATLLKAQETLADLQAGPGAPELSAAQATLARAQETLDDLTGGDGSTELAAAQATVKQAELAVEEAQLSLESAQSDLENTTLVAPMDGTVTEVLADVNDLLVDGSAIITLVDVSEPQVEVYIDESDMDSLVLGYEAEVVFDALPDDIYTGTVTYVAPLLEYVSGVSVIRGIITLDAESWSKPQGLMVGMNATVDVIGGRAKDAVLVPVEALRDLGDGQYGVFVIENGEPVFREVTVGLQDYTYAEITSGLSAGETVSTGITQVSE